MYHKIGQFSALATNEGDGGGGGKGEKCLWVFLRLHHQKLRQSELFLISL